MFSGLCPGLFTTSELLVLSSKFQTGKLKKTAEASYQAFAQAIQPNLHVIVTWNVHDFSTADTGAVFNPLPQLRHVDTDIQTFVRFEHERGLFSALSKACSYIDHYSHWSNAAYSEVALNYWSSTQSQYSSNNEALSFLAAHIHQTSHQMMLTLLPNKSGWFVNPECYVHFLQFASKVFNCLKKEKEVNHQYILFLCVTFNT